jgi:hypothetical protein
MLSEDTMLSCMKKGSMIATTGVFSLASWDAIPRATRWTMEWWSFLRLNILKMYACLTKNGLPIPISMKPNCFCMFTVKTGTRDFFSCRRIFFR